MHCGKQRSSQHGTTIQIVQPQPTALIDRETVTHKETPTNSDTQVPESAAPAPNEIPNVYTQPDLDMASQGLPPYIHLSQSCKSVRGALFVFFITVDLQHIGQRLLPCRRFVTAGGFTGSLQNQALFTTLNTPPQRLVCNAEECDSRIWLHVMKVGDKKISAKPRYRHRITINH